MTSKTADRDLYEQIKAVIDGADGDDKPETPAETEIHKVDAKKTIKAPYPSEEFSARHPDEWEWLKANHPACRDIPVPKFPAEHWHETARPMIPSPRKFENYIPHAFPLWCLYYGMLHSATTQLVGGKGGGKSSLPEYVCAMSGIPFWTMNCHRDTESADFFGSSGLVADGNKGAMRTQFNPAPLTAAMMRGGQGLMLLDEANRANLMPVQKVLEMPHTAILSDADGLAPNERVLAPDSARFWIMLADNTAGWGDDTGNYQAEVQDSSTNDRKRMNIHVPYMDAEREAAIINKHAPTLHSRVVAAMIDIATKIREAHNAQQLLDTASLRLLIPWAEDMETIGCPRLSFRMAFYDRQTETDKAVILKIWQEVGIFGDTI